jgi:hypothetical protein
MPAMNKEKWYKIVADEWVKTCKIRPNFQLDEWVTMLNHFHGIVIINDYSGKNQSLGAGQSASGFGCKQCAPTAETEFFIAMYCRV